MPIHGDQRSAMTDHFTGNARPQAFVMQESPRGELGTLAADDLDQPTRIA